MTIVILAAGLSKRMGEVNKLLLPWKNTTLLENTIKEALKTGEKVVVLTGYEKEKTEKLLENYPVRTLYNPEYESGQESSIRKALEIEDELLLTPADLPFLTAKELKKAMESLTGNKAVRFYFQKVPGHPVALSKELIRIIKANPGKKVKEIIEKEGCLKLEGTFVCTFDIDTPESYKEALSLEGSTSRGITVLP